MHDVRRADHASTAWESTGNDPAFRLTQQSRRQRPYFGWYVITIPIVYEDHPHHAPLLYYDDGRGESEDRVIRLNCTETGIHDLIFLPWGVRRLRLDPTTSPARFTLGEMRIARLGGLQGSLRQARLAAKAMPSGQQALMPVLRHATRAKSPARAWSRFVGMTRPKRNERSYAFWISQVEAKGRPSREAVAETIAGLAFRPLISIVMPVYNTPAIWLEAALRSVQAQSYGDWELCLCDDNSSAPHIAPMLKEWSERDPRIKMMRRAENGRISLATNDAMGLATGAYMTLMDHDDTIDEDALFEFVKVLNEDRSVDFIYSDEDKISVEDERYEPFFKPDWSPEYLESCMYTAHLALYRMDIVRETGLFRDACNGAQDYDFVLRYTERVTNVRHLRKILYHWRAIPGSTAQSMDAKNYVIDAALRALRDRADRTGACDIVRMSPYAGGFELRRKLVERPLISIVIPSAGRNTVIGGVDTDILAACVRGIRERSTYESVEIVVVDNGDLRPDTRAVLDANDARTVTYDKPVFNVAEKMNLGARAARGEVLVFLNDDIDVISPDWLEAMLALLQRPGVGLVGPRLLFEDGQLQHVGVTFDNGLPDHIRRGYPRNDPGYFFSTVSNRNYLAVTGACAMLRRADFERVGGFEEAFAVNYNDIDLCLKIVREGLRVVYCGQAELYHYESRNRARTVDSSEQDLFLARWSELTKSDPYYGPWFQTRPPTFEMDPLRF